MQMKAVFAVAVFVQVLKWTTMAVQAQPITPQEKLSILNRIYPSAVAGYRNGYMILKSGERLTIDDGERKDHQGKLVDADIKDML